jgi:hypothetical protein
MAADKEHSRTLEKESGSLSSSLYFRPADKAVKNCTLYYFADNAAHTDYEENERERERKRLYLLCSAALSSSK